MGNAAGRDGDLEVSKISVDYDQDSPSGSGFKSVVSQPLDEIIDHDSLWSSVIRLLKDPPKLGLLKASECKEASEKEFATRLMFAVGVAGNLLGFEDFEMTERCFHDRAKGELMTERYDQEGILLQTVFTKFHKDPLVVESWLELPQSRHSSWMVAVSGQDVLKKARDLTNPAAKGEGNIPMHHEQESLSGSGLRACVSDPLMDHFEDLDQLWDGWIKAVKADPRTSTPQDEKSVFSGSPPEAKIAHWEVKEISETEFNVISVIDGDSIDKGFNWFQRFATPVDSLLALRSAGDKQTVIVYIADRSKAEIVAQYFNDLGLLILEAFVRFYEDPLRVEMWVEQAKARKSGRMLCVTVWTFLNRIIKDFKEASSTLSNQVADDL